MCGCNKKQSQPKVGRRTVKTNRKPVKPTTDKKIKHE